MAQVTIYKPLVPLWQRWSVRAQAIFIALNAGLMAAWEIAKLNPDFLKRWGLDPLSDTGTFVGDLIFWVTLINAFYSAFTIALAAAKQKGGTAPPEQDDKPVFEPTQPGGSS